MYFSNFALLQPRDESLRGTDGRYYGGRICAGASAVSEAAAGKTGREGRKWGALKREERKKRGRQIDMAGCLFAELTMC